MKHYQQLSITVIAVDNEDVVTASVYAEDVYDDDWTGITFEEGV